MKRKKIMVTIAIIFMALILLVFYLREIREHSIFYASQTLFSGDKIEIKYDDNCRKYWYSFPERHAIITIGGGDGRNDIYFEYKKIKYHFRTYYAPILINDFKEKLYFVTHGYVDNLKIKQKQLQFFRFDNEWKRIKPEEFPKSIAIPNIYYIRDYPVLWKADEINPDLKDFRCSLTAKLWLHLETKTKYSQMQIKNFKPYEVDKNFLIEYKKKYIDPYWNEKKLNENVPVIVVPRQFEH